MIYVTRFQAHGMTDNLHDLYICYSVSNTWYWLIIFTTCIYMIYVTRFQAHGMADHLHDLDLSEATQKQVAQVT